MDVQKLKTIHEKIIDAVDCIVRLRTENAALKKQQAQLNTEIEQQKTSIDKLNTEIDSYGNNFSELEEAVNQSFAALSTLEKELEKNEFETESTASDDTTTNAAETVKNIESVENLEAVEDIENTEGVEQISIDEPEIAIEPIAEHDAPLSDTAVYSESSTELQEESNASQTLQFDALAEESDDESEQHTFASESDKQINESTEKFLNKYNNSDSSPEDTDASNADMDLYSDFVKETHEIKENNDLIDIITSSGTDNTSDDNQSNAENFEKALKDEQSTLDLSLKQEEMRAHTTSLWNTSFANTADVSPAGTKVTQQEEMRNRDHFSLFDFPNTSSR